MAVTRKKHTPQSKVKVAVEAIKGQMTTAEITAKYGVHTSQINAWKKKAMEIIPDAFSNANKRAQSDQQALIDELYKQIGQLTVERDWMKKKSDLLG
jgi:transposase-like protein